MQLAMCLNQILKAGNLMYKTLTSTCLKIEEKINNIIKRPQNAQNKAHTT